MGVPAKDEIIMKRAELLDILLSAWTQFAWRSYVDHEPHLIDGGLSTLEEIRAVLVEHRMIHPKTGLPPGYPTDEKGGFAIRNPAKRRIFVPKSARNTKTKGKIK